MILENFLENLMPWVTSHGIKVLAILIVALIATRFIKIFIFRFLESLIKNGVKFGKVESKLEEKRLKTLEEVSFIFLKAIIWMIAIITILPEFGVEIVSLLAGLGIGALALGLAAKSLIQDYLSGLFILLEDQYRVGEEIEIVGGRDRIKGKVEGFNLRTTIIRDSENTLHYISNSKIDKVANFARK